MAKIVELIITDSTVGFGTEQDICRKRYELFAKDGTLVCMWEHQKTLHSTANEFVNYQALQDLLK